MNIMNDDVLAKLRLKISNVDGIFSTIPRNGEEAEFIITDIKLPKDMKIICWGWPSNMLTK